MRIDLKLTKLNRLLYFLGSHSCFRRGQECNPLIDHYSLFLFHRKAIFPGRKILTNSSWPPFCRLFRFGGVARCNLIARRGTGLWSTFFHLDRERCGDDNLREEVKKREFTWDFRPRGQIDADGVNHRVFLKNGNAE